MPCSSNTAGSVMRLRVSDLTDHLGWLDQVYGSWVQRTRYSREVGRTRLRPVRPIRRPILGSNKPSNSLICCDFWKNGSKSPSPPDITFLAMKTTICGRAFCQGPVYPRLYPRLYPLMPRGSPSATSRRWGPFGARRGRYTPPGAQAQQNSPAEPPGPLKGWHRAGQRALIEGRNATPLC